MPEEQTLTPDTIAEAAAEPVAVTADGQSATDHSISEKIKAAQFEAANKGGTSRKRGIRLLRCINPGSV